LANESRGAIFVPKSSAELRDQFLRDVRLAAIDTGVDEPPVQPGTDWYLIGSALAELELIGLANIAIADEDRSVLTATGDALDDIREAYGLPEVEPSGSSGKIRPTIQGATTIVAGTEFVMPNGLRGRTTDTVISPVDGDEISAEAIDTGKRTNLAGGQIVRFTSPPANVAVDARVSFGSPLTGGTDEETDDRKRDRILNVLRNKPAGGNWAHVRQNVLDNVGSIVDCYVYPALGGPGSAKVVPVKDFDPDNNDFSRAATDAMLDSARQFVHADLPTPQEIVVQASADQNVDAALHVTIPASVQSGGNGRGWTDATVWPGGVSTRVLVTNYVDATPRLDVDAATATSPTAGTTHVAWWSPDDRKFYTALVTAVGGSAGAWQLTLDRPLVSKDGTVPAAGDYVSPAAQNLDKYGKSWVDLFRKLGPGENTSDAFRLPRASRHPFVDDEDPSDLTTPALLDLVKSNPEITDIEYGYLNDGTANVPADVEDAPNILVPRHFGVYEQ
jgi:hypothetical protein